MHGHRYRVHAYPSKGFLSRNPTQIQYIKGSGFVWVTMITIVFQAAPLYINLSGGTIVSAHSRFINRKVDHV
jgi:hypothetical protein